MANFFPCPNPACTYQFDADQLPAAAMVTCPICRTRFPYRAAAPAPVPQQEAAEEGDFEGSAPAAQSPARERPNRLVNAHYVPKSNKSQTALILTGFTLAVAAVLAVIMVSMKSHRWFDNSGPGADRYTQEEFNFRFSTFDREKWREDADRRGSFGLNGFCQRQRDSDGDADAWIGLRCIKFGNNGDRGPYEGELDKEMKGVLAKFTGHQEDPLTVTIAGQQVNGLKFTGNMGETTVWGEIHAFHNKGIGYVFVIWASAEKWSAGAKDELTKYRDTFSFANLRDKTTLQSGQSKFYFVEGGEYQLEDTFDLWQRGFPDANGDKGAFPRDPRDEDDNATMVFRCLHPDDRNKLKISDRRYPANAYVMVLQKVNDNLDDVKKYVFDMLKIKKGDGIALEAYQKLPFEFTMPASAATVGSYKLTHSADRDFKYFYVIAVKKVNGQTVAVVGWCKESLADVMGPYILRFAASLKDRQ